MQTTNEAQTASNGLGRTLPSSGDRPADLAAAGALIASDDPKRDDLSLGLFKVLRGAHNQSNWSRRLNVSPSTICKIESGQNRIHWDLFAAACAVQSIDLLSVFSQLDLSRINSARVPVDLTARMVFRALTNGIQPKDLSPVLQTSTSSISRWRNGQTKVPLSAILDMLRHAGILEQFVSLVLTQFEDNRSGDSNHRMMPPVLKEFLDGDAADSYSTHTSSYDSVGLSGGSAVLGNVKRETSVATNGVLPANAMSQVEAEIRNAERRIREVIRSDGRDAGAAEVEIELVIRKPE